MSEKNIKTTVKISGLDCAACAAELEEILNKIEGVNSCSVSFVNQTIAVDCEGKEALSAIKKAASSFEEVKVVEDGIKQTIRISGLDCAACAAELEEILNKIEGVNSCSVSFVNQTIIADCDGEETLKKIKETASSFEEVKVVEVRSDKAKVIKIKNLDCPNCAAALQEQIEKIDGVNCVVVDFVAQNIVIDATPAAIEKAKKAANHFEKVKVIEEGEEAEEKSSRKKSIIEIIISAVLLGAGLLVQYLLAPKALAWQITEYVLYAAAYLIVGYPVLISTAKNISKGRIFDENFLMTVASIGAVCLSVFTAEDEFAEGVMVMLLYQIGELLQGIAVGSSRKSIAAVMDLKSDSATLIDGEKRVTVSPEQLKVGNIIEVKAGEKIPVDGIILTGKTSFDTKSLTGESALRAVEEGDEVLSGWVNAGGVITVKVIREYSDSAVAKILDLVENSSAQKAKPEKFITKFAKYYTPIVCCSAVALAVLVPLITHFTVGGELGALFVKWINTALVCLVISCPCALIISVPLTYFGGIGTAAKYGILIKGATYLDEISKVKTVAMDKTGTLTKGEFSITGVVAEDKDKALSVAAAIEKHSSHPVARPFIALETPYTAINAEEVAGRGIRAEINGEIALCGNAKMFREENIAFEEGKSIATLIYVALGGKYLGYIEIDDSLKAEAAASLNGLHAQGVKKIAMLTGDTAARAQSVSKEIAVDEVYPALLPDEKLSIAQKLKEEAAADGGKIMFVGDGINDAPVMTVSDCAVSMGQIGSGAAIEASDIVLISDDLTALVKAFKIAKRTKKIVIENIVFSITVKVAFMVMGIVIPSFPLALAVFGDVGVMLLAVLNSLRIRRRVK